MSDIRIRHSSPFLDDDEVDACQKVIRSGYLAKGQECSKFSEELAERYQRKYVILTNCGASALHMSLLAMGCGPDSRVHLPSYVCSSLLNVVNYTGASVGLSDSSHERLFMDPSLPMLTEDKNEFLIYPQMFGVVQSLNKKKTDKVIEDCAMSTGATALKQGKVSTMSFYATKMLTTGQGGAILTDDESLYAEIVDLMAYDNQKTYRVRYNVDMSDLAAAVGRKQLKKLSEISRRRTELVENYDRDFKDSGLLADQNGLQTKYKDAVLFRYWIRVSNLKECIESLFRQGIEVKSPVFQPLHKTMGMKDSDFPGASLAQEQICSLPLYPGLDKKDQQQVVQAILKIAKPV